MAKIVLVCLISLLACAAGQRIITINLEGVQYFISRMNPYSPELNFFLAYQYCRSIGLQLASFETKEKSSSIMQYLTNGGYSNYDFWTSGNRLGSDMFIWKSTGLPFNTTFNYFRNSADAIQSGLLNPVDYNSNTSPQRTARDSSSGTQKNCVILSKPDLEWMPEDCLAVKDFICEQTRCYYYNYGSIPVSSAQGRPITTTTKRPSTVMEFISSTTSLPIMSTYASMPKKNQPESVAQPSFASLKLDHERALEATDDDKINDEESADTVAGNEENDADIVSDDAAGGGGVAGDDVDDNVDERNHELNQVKKQIIKLAKDEIDRERDDTLIAAHDDNENFHEQDKEIESDGVETVNTDGVDVNQEEQQQDEEEEENPQSDLINNSSVIEGLDESKQHSLPTNDIPSVEMRLKQISQEIEKIASGESHIDNRQRHHGSSIGGDSDDLGRQSFLSLTDLIRTLRPNDKQIPQIDSDYSNAMRVLGETSSLVGNDESRKYKETDSAQQQQLNRALF